MATMAWAASATCRVSVGTCVSLPGEHDPIVLAKTLASLDVMSGGRVVYGEVLEIRDGVVQNPRILSFQGREPDYPHRVSVG